MPDIYLGTNSQCPSLLTRRRRTFIPASMESVWWSVNMRREPAQDRGEGGHVAVFGGGGGKDAAPAPPPSRSVVVVIVVVVLVVVVISIPPPGSVPPKAGSLLTHSGRLLQADLARAAGQGGSQSRRGQGRRGRSPGGAQDQGEGHSSVAAAAAEGGERGGVGWGGVGWGSYLRRTANRQNIWAVWPKGGRGRLFFFQIRNKRRRKIRNTLVLLTVRALGGCTLGKQVLRSARSDGSPPPPPGPAPRAGGGGGGGGK